jgi:hypothetical protein
MQQSNDNTIRAIPPVICVFTKGDSFINQYGERVHVMGERYMQNGRELLFCRNGLREWARETKYWRAI